MSRWLLPFLLAVAGQAVAMQEMVVAPFSTLAPGGPLPDDWQVSTVPKVPRHTQFSLVDFDATVVLRAQSSQATAALLKKLRVDPMQYPVLSWSWKISALIRNSDIRSRDGDDYPARVYVTFDVDPAQLSIGERARIRLGKLLYGADLPLAALCYVWDGKAPAGTIVPNAYSDRVRMVVVRSGSRNVGDWMREQRNIAEDYRRAFGSAAPLITSIGVSVDTDNTGESVESYFGDISLRTR